MNEWWGKETNKWRKKDETDKTCVRRMCQLRKYTPSKKNALHVKDAVVMQAEAVGAVRPLDQHAHVAAQAGGAKILCG